ncbi:MAG: hypothetical protein LBO69_02585 [Ignavibacteria bacterium]|jgi:hypothetical protein|nr:hypothetical protein [Ignavibacteria bacterium]
MKIEYGTDIYESQSLQQNKLVRVISICLVAGMLWSEYKAVLEVLSGEFSFTYILVLTLLSAYAIIFLYTGRLETSINSESISICFRLFPFKVRHTYLWDDVKMVRILECRPIRDFGGWGVRTSPTFGSGYTVSGKVGISLHLLNNQKIFIGTNLDPEWLRERLV